MPTSFDVTLSFGSVDEKELPFKKMVIQRLFRLLKQNLKKERRYLETLEILGRAPQSLHLHFCDDVEMRVFQKRYRKLDRTTDILSFPSRELEAPKEALEDLDLGDLVVSLEAVGRGAKRGRRSQAEELFEVLIHGFLHLIGHDHVKNRRDASEMFRLQRELFRSLSRVIKLKHEPQSKFRAPASKSTRNSRQAKRTKRTA